MFSLNLHNIEHWINYKSLFKPISFELKDGQICYLHGHNGVGKTTLIQIMLGLLPYHAGHMVWRAPTPCQNQQPEAWMAYIGHKPGINLQLTVAENLALWHAMYACSEESKQQTAEHLKQFKLNACLHIFAGNLSAGQQKRLAWVRLLAQHRTIWLLDESFTHLDTHALQIAIQHIKAHAEQGGSVLFTSHQDLSDQIKSDQMLTLEGNHD